MDPINILLIVAGIAIFIVTFKKVKGIKIPNPIIGVLCAVALAGVGLYGYENIDISGEPAQIATAVECPEFDIVPTVSTGNGVLNLAETEINIPFLANTTSHTIDEGDNTTWVDTAISFFVSPSALEQGADADQTATVYYEVTSPGQTVDSSSGTYYMVTKTSGRWQNIFTGSGTEYNSGSHTMLITTNVTLVLTIDTDQTGMSYIANTYSPQTLTVKFSNGCGWYEEFDVKYICTLSGATAT